MQARIRPAVLCPCMLMYVSVCGCANRASGDQEGMEEGGGKGGQKGREGRRESKGERKRGREREGDKGRGREVRRGREGGTGREGGRYGEGGTWTKERGGASLSAAIAVRASSESGNWTRILRRQCPSMFAI
jgi:hypothetical protein